MATYADAMPMKLEAHVSEDIKRRWKVVRTDNYSDVPGEIVSADEATGECILQVPNAEGVMEAITFNFGARGIRLVWKQR